jgi:hypothetical protein
MSSKGELHLQCVRGINRPPLDMARIFFIFINYFELEHCLKFKGEANLPEIWPEPLQLIVRTLSEYHN